MKADTGPYPPQRAVSASRIARCYCIIVAVLALLMSGLAGPALAISVSVQAIHNGEIDDTSQQTFVRVFDSQNNSVDYNYPFPGGFNHPEAASMLIGTPFTYGGQEYSRVEVWGNYGGTWELDTTHDNWGDFFIDDYPTSYQIRAYFTDPDYTLTNMNTTISNQSAGDPYTVAWDVDEGANGSTLLDLFLSTNGGSTWTQLNGSPIPWNQDGDFVVDGSYTYTVPEVVSTNCKLRLHAYDIAGNEDEWISNTFAISNGPPAPIPTYPEDGWYVAYPIPPTTFTWTGNPDDDFYNFEVATDANFNNLVFQQQLLNPSYELSGLSPNTYYWRVNAVVNPETSVWSPTRSFVIVPINTATPEAIQPLGVLVPDADGMTQVTFQWSESDPSLHYTLEIDEGSVFVEPYLYELTELADPTWSAEFANGNYVWRVRVLDAGHASYYTTDNAFALSNTIPTPLQPVAGASFASPDEVVFEWTAVEGSFAYQLEVATSSSFDPGSIVKQDYATTTTHSLDTSWFRSTDTYWWRVRAYADGVWQAFSNASSFDYAYSFTPYFFLPDVNSTVAGAGSAVSSVLNNDVDASSFTNSTYRVWNEFSGHQDNSLSITANRWLKVSTPSNFFPGERVTSTMTTGLQAVSGEHLGAPYNYTFTVQAEGYGEFHAAYELPQPEASFDNCIADFNGDGWLDIASAERFDNSVSIILNQGDGTFGPYTTYPAGPVGYEDYQVWSVIPGDYDNDGDVDLVSGNYGDYSISYYRNYGNGTFATGIVYEKIPWIGGAPSEGESADIDGDGDLDLIFGSSSDVMVFENIGNGFDVDFVAYSTGGDAQHITVGDFDGDGDVDIAATNIDTDNIRLLFNDGSGNFTLGGNYPAPEYPVEIVSGDVDNDFDLDLCVVNHAISGNSTVRVLRNDGSGGFSSSTSYGVNGNQAVSLGLFDADGDDFADLVLGRNGTSNQFAVYLNDGTGNLGTPTYLSLSGPSGSYYRPNGLAYGDLNNDGTIDVALSHFYPDASTVLFNLTAPRQVTLYSPLDGKPIPHTSPNLDWLPVPEWGVEYTVQFDTDPTFADPVAREYVGPVDYWTVTPSVAEGVWYWRVRASNVAGDGPWSETRHVVVDVPDPSCPVLFSFDGESFVHQNPLLTACEASGYKDVVTDYYLLPSAPALVDGKVQFELRELEDEVTYLRDLELMTVDAPAGARVTCTTKGEVSAYLETIEPIAAVDQDGNDVLDLILAEDGERLDLEGSGTITVTFPRVVAGGVIGTTSGGKIECPVFEDDPGEVQPKGTTSSLQAEVLSLDGDWKNMASIPLRQLSRLETFSLDVTESSDDPFQVRLNWSGRLETDVIVQYVPMDEAPAVARHRVDRFDQRISHPEGVFGGSLGAGDPIELRHGDVLAFEFDVDADVAEGMTRHFIVKATGRYQPDYAVHTGMTPTHHRMHGNFPNPFNPSTSFKFDLAKRVGVNLTVFDVRGRRVKTLVDGEPMDPGAHAILWDGRDDAGAPIASGTYLYRFSAGEYEHSGRVLLVK